VAELRSARAHDFAAIQGVVDDWWGRPVSGSLPRLFLDHFFGTSLIVKDGQGLAAFLIGFQSPSQPAIAYIHFVGVRPDLRGSGLARRLYDTFAQRAAASGSSELHAITSPANGDSIRFHQRLGFTTSEPIQNYNGFGRPMVVFTRSLP